MKIKPTYRLLAVFAGMLGLGFYFVLLPQLKGTPAPTVAVSDGQFGWKYPVAKFPTTGPGEIAFSDVRDPGGIPQGLPVRLQIPIINVDSLIEDALITPDGRMDVPSGSVNVAWFALGPHPGQEGSAVIGGHFGIFSNVPFVFFNLDKVKIGDKVYIVNDKGETLAFVVRMIKSFDRNADATTVFTSDDGLAHLNLITCEGVWNQSNGTYPQRLVVFTDAIAPEGAVLVSPTPFPIVTPAPDTAVQSRTLSMGSRGDDVVVLQNALIQKGFLKMPAGVAKGTFGSLTRTAVSNFQNSVGLPETGVYDASTRALLVPSLPTTAITPVPSPTETGEPLTTPTPEQSMTPTPSPTEDPTETPSDLSLNVQSLFTTPLDGIITLLLLIAIIFMVFKIIKL